MRRLLASLGLLVCLAGCSIGKDVPLAQAGIDDFHQKLNAGQFDAIYDHASPVLKATTPQTDMVRLFAAIHRKLGPFKSGSAGSWNDNVNTSGHFITIGYSAVYAGGAADESFVYRIDGGQALLAGYHVNSLALIEQ